MFELLKKLKTALGGAGGILEERDKITAAIERERTKLAGLIEQREAAEKELATADVEAKSSAAARRKLYSAQAGITESALKLHRLRGMLAALSVKLEQAHAAVKTELPEHFQTIRQQFVEDWSRAAAAFSLALGKRAAIEALTGSPLVLSDPAPAAVALPEEYGEPGRRLEEIKAALAAIADMGWANSEPLRLPAGRVPKVYDQTLIYVLCSAAEGLPAGTKVVSASLSDGLLARLVALGDATPAGSAEEGQGTFDAENALRRISQADAEEQQERARREAKAKFDAAPDVDVKLAQRRRATWEEMKEFDKERELYPGWENLPAHERMRMQPTTPRGPAMTPEEELAAGKREIERVIDNATSATKGK